MYCPKCGTENPNFAMMCSFCRAELYNDAAAPAASAAPKTSGLAIAALILAIISPCTLLVTALPALIMAIVSLILISKNPQKLKGKGLAITGIILPIIFIPIIIFLVIIPSLIGIKHVANVGMCQIKMLKISSAITKYSINQGSVPDPEQWCDLISEQSRLDPNDFKCPSAKDNEKSSYAMNDWLKGKSLNDVPGYIVMLFEAKPGWNQAGGPELLKSDRHIINGCNVIFADGTNEFVTLDEIKYLKWNDDS